MIPRYVEPLFRPPSEALSVTAILGLAGRGRSISHARATAVWVNQVNPLTENGHNRPASSSPAGENMLIFRR